MTKTPLVDHLDLVEQQFNEVSLVLAQGDPVRLEVAGAILHKLSAGLVELMRTATGDAAMRDNIVQRLKALAEGTTVLRTQLHRQAALVEQTLKVVLPTGPASTYADSGPYGSAMRQSGAFKVLSA